ncbi:ABC transporter permease [Cellulosilyticum ruminicola]|uniref:ABC transporter permease n=1 Tax=Cellulosilyticum ruminicola TaxID=425254 RepID=UPI0006D04D23|nr:ABC transporter permease [Cellulosilyticum ruminicola]
MRVKYKSLIVTLIIVILNILVLRFVELPKDNNMQLSYAAVGNFKTVYQTLYSDSNVFDGRHCVEMVYEKKGDKQELTFDLPSEYKWIRLDFGNYIDHINLSCIELSYMKQKIDLSSRILREGNISNDIGNITTTADGNIEVDVVGGDPYIVLDLTDVKFETVVGIENVVFKIIVCVLLTALILVLQKYMGSLISLLKELNVNKKLIWNLSKNDFRTKYAGSYLGITWAFVQPIVTVIIYWFVFQVGFKSAPMNDFPFVLWLIAGMVPWFFFNEALLNATNSLLEYNYLVKKVVFKISILPIVKIMSSLYVHIFFIVFANIVYLIGGHMPSIYMLQVVYYLFCTFFLVLGLSYATSAIIIFFKDLGQIVNILLQFGMWLTPIMWSNEMIGPRYQWVLKINPMYYIVEGYRDTFIRHVWFWERYNQTMYFWFVAIVLFGVGALIFKRLKVHFADVL